jgi:hypothetical protein
MIDVPSLLPYLSGYKSRRDLHVWVRRVIKKSSPVGDHFGSPALYFYVVLGTRLTQMAAAAFLCCGSLVT